MGDVTLAMVWDKLQVIQSLLEQKDNPTTTTNDAKPADLGTRTLKSEAITFCMQLDWLFVRSANGQYNHTIANRAAADFLSKHGPYDRNRLSDALRERRSSLEGRVRVEPGLFENLFRDFVLNGR